MHLDPSNRLYRDSDSVQECPHCRSESRMMLTASPDFRALQKTRPEVTGVVYQCGNCHAPVFYRYRIRKLGDTRIDFYPVPVDGEKPEDKFNFAYLPDQVAAFYRDALGCYHNDLLQAFAALCRLTTQATIADRGDNAKLQIYAQVDEIAELANLDEKTFHLLRNILFDTRPGTLYLGPDADKTMAAILLETMKDILQQSYVRRGRLRKALRMRQFFASAEDSDKSGVNLSLARSTGTD